MRLKFKDTTLETNTPITYSDLQLYIITHFNSSIIGCVVITPEDQQVVKSTSDYEKIPINSILEIEVFTEVPSPDEFHNPFKKFDSIDTCTSHEKTDSDESKNSELMLSMTLDTSLVNIPKMPTLDFFIDAKSGKEYKDASTCMNEHKNNFSAQYDQPFKIEYEDMKNLISRIIISCSHKTKSNTFQHENFFCSVCKAKPIVGIRYECSTCKMNFCEDCEEANPHEHDRLVHKGNLKASIEVLDHKEQLIKKVADMGFKDIQKVKLIAEKHRYDLNKTVRELLFN